jgi:hypothetical protein
MVILRSWGVYNSLSQHAVSESAHEPLNAIFQRFWGSFMAPSCGFRERLRASRCDLISAAGSLRLVRNSLPFPRVLMSLSM